MILRVFSMSAITNLLLSSVAADTQVVDGGWEACRFHRNCGGGSDSKGRPFR
jgi:hypothetical protein